MDAKHLFAFVVLGLGLAGFAWRVRGMVGSPTSDVLRIKRDYESSTRKVTRVRRTGVVGAQPGNPIYRTYEIEVTDEEVGVFDAVVGVEMTTAGDPELRTFRGASPREKS